MVSGFAFNIPMTCGLLTTYHLWIGDVSNAIASPTSYPFLALFLLIFITTSSYAWTLKPLFVSAQDKGITSSRNNILQE